MEVIRKSPTGQAGLMSNGKDTVSIPENQLNNSFSQFPELDPNYRPAWQASEVVDVTPSLDTLLDKALIHHAERIPKPDTVLAIEQDGQDIPVWTRGSVSGIIGKAKGGKTGWVAVAVAAVLSGRVDGGNVALTSTATGNVLFFDTEQGRYYGSVTLGRIRQLAPDGIGRLKYYDLREHQPQKRLELIRRAIQLESEPPALVVLDGLRDVVFDINASDEAIIILTDLMAVSVTHDTHIVCVLHQNKGDANARGHLGTELINKAEAIFSANKDTNNPNASIIEPEQMRGLSPNPIGMERDGNGTPYLTGAVVRGSGGVKPAGLESFQVWQLFSAAYCNGDRYSYAELVRQLKLAHEAEHGKVGDNRIKEFITLAKNKGWVVQSASREPYVLGDYEQKSPSV